MNLTDLQMELRSMEKHISELQKAIEGMKPKTEEEEKEDFARITRLALEYPIKDTNVSRVSPVLQKEYMQALSWLMLSFGSKKWDRLLYLCRIASGCGMELHAEELYRAGLEFQPEDMEKICMDFQKLKYAFLADALVIANISGEASEKEISLIADIARVFGCEKWEVQVTALIAKGILIGNWDVLEEVSVFSKDRWKMQENFRQLIPEEWIVSHRRECGRLCVEEYNEAQIKKYVENSFRNFFEEKSQGSLPKYPCIIKSRLQTGELVTKGDALVTYEKEIKQEEKIYAPCDGVVFFLEDREKDAETGKKMKYIAAYVVSYFDDYQKFSIWYWKNKKRKEKQ